MSALFVTSFKSLVLECAIVTVAFSLSINIAIGFPTILLLPITTHSLPSISMSVLLIISIIPAGVQGKNVGAPMVSSPTL